MAASFVTDSARGLFNTFFGYGSEPTVDQSGDKSSEPAGKLDGKTVWIVNVVADDEWSGVVEVQVDLKTRMTPDVPVQLMNNALCFLEPEFSTLEHPRPDPQAFASARRRIQSHLTEAAAQCLREQLKHAAESKDGSCANTGDFPIFVALHEVTPKNDVDVDWSDPHRMTATAIIHESDVRRAEQGDLTLLLDANNGAPRDASDSTGKSTLRFHADWSEACEGIYEPFISCDLVEDHLKDPTVLPALKALQHVMRQTSCPATETEFPQKLKTIKQARISKARRS